MPVTVGSADVAFVRTCSTGSGNTCVDMTDVAFATDDVRLVSRDVIWDCVVFRLLTSWDTLSSTEGNGSGSGGSGKGSAGGSVELLVPFMLGRGSGIASVTLPTMGCDTLEMIWTTAWVTFAKGKWVVALDAACRID